MAELRMNQMRKVVATMQRFHLRNAFAVWETAATLSESNDEDEPGVDIAGASTRAQSQWGRAGIARQLAGLQHEAQERLAAEVALREAAEAALVLEQIEREKADAALLAALRAASHRP